MARIVGSKLNATPIGVKIVGSGEINIQITLFEDWLWADEKNSPFHLVKWGVFLVEGFGGNTLPKEKIWKKNLIKMGQFYQQIQKLGIEDTCIYGRSIYLLFSSFELK